MVKTTPAVYDWKRREEKCAVEHDWGHSLSRRSTGTPLGLRGKTKLVAVIQNTALICELSESEGSLSNRPISPTEVTYKMQNQPLGPGLGLETRNEVSIGKERKSICARFYGVA